MTAHDLKPCPFCGGEATAVPDSNHSTGWEVGCFSRSCAIEPQVWAVHKSTAEMQWNTRAVDPAAIREAALREAAPVPSEPNWKNEAMRQNALLHSAMMGSANAEARATQLELERDALLRVVTDNHVALTRAETAEAKLAKAVEALKNISHGGGYTDMQIARAALAELEKAE